MSNLSAIVIGAGWAGEGHTRALRYAGVDVHTICARNPEVTRAVADRLEIPNASTDWRATLEATRPDIVAIATPASLRTEPILLAAKLGCHVYCDKPLAVDAPTAKELLDAVQRAGVKTAYAATCGLHPGFAWLSEQIAAGAVGSVREVEANWRLPQPAATHKPWTWMDSLARGGGPLNNAIPHLFAIIEQMLGGQVTCVAGHCRPGRKRAPVLPDIHDQRQLFGPPPSEESLEDREWRRCDVEGSSSLLAEVAATDDRDPPARLVAVLSGDIVAAWPSPGFRVYGTAGTLAVDGYVNAQNIRLWTEPGTDPTPLPTPQRLIDAIPPFEGDGDHYVQGKWAALARDFVADIRGLDHDSYLTFADGYRYQVAIDAIRAGAGWTQLA